MRWPYGGALAFIGKTTTCCGLIYNELSRTIDRAFVADDDFVPIGVALIEGIDASYTGPNPFFDVLPAVEIPLLGDPSIVPWRERPAPLTIDTSPASITALGVQTLTVAVEDSLASPVQDALVCVRQGATTYATGRTDASGVAVFRGIAFQNTTDVELSAWRPQYAVAETTLTVSVSAAQVVYASHEVDDSAGGDGDGVLEPGETADLIVTFKNEGTATASSFAGAIRQTPSVLLALKIDGEYRAGSTFLGPQAANPAPEQEVLRVPLTKGGVRLEGAPTLSSNPDERFEIYRDHATGLYKLITVSPSQSADTVFTGTIVAKGGLSSVTTTIEGNDQVIATADSIWFSLKGDATPDIVSFAAEAPQWIALGTTTSSLGSIAPGDSATAIFSVTALEDLPDEQDLVFTASAYTGFSNSKTYSDFAVTTVRPMVELAHIQRSLGDFGCADTTWKWTPSVWNSGSSEADSVVLILRITGGDMTVQDSIVVMEDVGIRELASGDSWLLCGDTVADTAGLEVEISLEVYHNGQRTMAVIADPGSSGGGCGESCGATISGLRAELQDGGVILRWNASEHCQSVRYHIGVQPLQGPPQWFAIVGPETTQFFIHDINGVPLDPQGPDGYPSYEFLVRSVRCTQTVDILTTGDNVYTWAKEREGWPVQLISGRSRCAPMVVDLDQFGHEDVSGVAIFAATDAIYAFREDGSPLDPDHFAGHFFDPQGLDETATRGFTSELSVGDWNTDVGTDGPEIIGNLYPGGLYMVSIVPDESGECCEADLLWSKDFSASGLDLVAPGSVIAKVLQKEGESDLPVVFLGGTEDTYVYAWEGNGDGDPYGDAQGRLFDAGSGATYNYRSLAIGFRTPDPEEPEDEGEFELIHSTRNGKVHAIPLSFTNPQAQVPARWTWDSQTADFLSTPAVGDVDGDGSNEIVVTSRNGSIWVIDENTKNIDASERDSVAWQFSGEGDNPAAGPTLADLDDDGDLEILAMTRAPGGDGLLDFDTKYVHKLLVFDYDNGDLTVSAAMDSVPFSQRTFNGAGVIGSVVIGDHDSFITPPEPLWDVYGATNSGAIFKFGVNPSGLLAFAQEGWPLILPEATREPVLAVLDPSEPSQASLVVQGEDGWLHVFDLGRQDDDRDVVLQWPSAGLDGGNTRGRLSFGQARPAPQSDIASLRLAAIRSGQSGRTFVMEATRPTHVELDVFDMSGRHVREVFDGNIPEGATELRWDGRLSSGGSAPSGVYAFRVKSAVQTFTGKVVLVK